MNKEDNSNLIKDISVPVTNFIKLVLRLKTSRTTKNKFIWIIIIALLLLLLIPASILFLILPTSIFGEASDLTHHQRDEYIKSISSSSNHQYSITNDELIKTINEYKRAWFNLIPEDYNSNNRIAPESSKGSITPEELDIICAIIQAESGDNYEGARAVASCVINRLAEGTWNNSWEREKKLKSSGEGTNDPLTILTAKGQFAAYVDYHYLNLLNNISENVRQAVIDVFEKGELNHNYLCFRSYETADSINIEGNWYFGLTQKDTSDFRYRISSNLKENDKEVESNKEIDINNQNTSNQNETPNPDNTVYLEEDHEFINKDPNGEQTWDLLYLICAYDASKKNIEGEVLDEEGNEVSRYKDLIYGIGEYIIKATFGVSVDIKKKEIKEEVYPIYEEVSLNIIEDNNIKTKQFYKKVGEATTKTPIIANLYEQVILHTIPDGIDLTGKSLEKFDEETLEFILNNGVYLESYQSENTDQYYIKKEETERIEPQEIEVAETVRVKGLQKSVLLSVLGLSPNDPYYVFNNKKDTIVTNADYIEYSRSSLIKVLNLSNNNFNLLDDGFIDNGIISQEGWIWPLDPNGYGSFVITSLMGTRESPGGIGSTDHGGTDIGAATGVAILAVQDGIVEIASTYGGYGNCVRLNHGTGTDGNNYQSLYGHMSRIACSVGQKVKQGQIIGYVGSTGWSTGPHLHFEAIRNSIKINGLSMYDDSIFNRLTYYL